MCVAGMAASDAPAVFWEDIGMKAAVMAAADRGDSDNKDSETKKSANTDTASNFPPGHSGGCGKSDSGDGVCEGGARHVLPGNLTAWGRGSDAFASSSTPRSAASHADTSGAARAHGGGAWAACRALALARRRRAPLRVLFASPPVRSLQAVGSPLGIISPPSLPVDRGSAPSAAGSTGTATICRHPSPSLSGSGYHIAQSGPQLSGSGSGSRGSGLAPATLFSTGGGAPRCTL